MESKWNWWKTLLALALSWSTLKSQKLSSCPISVILDLTLNGILDSVASILQLCHKKDISMLMKILFLKSPSILMLSIMTLDSESNAPLMEWIHCLLTWLESALLNLLIQFNSWNLNVLLEKKQHKRWLWRILLLNLGKLKLLFLQTMTIVISLGMNSSKYQQMGRQTMKSDTCL